jgi:hypothetical protein
MTTSDKSLVARKAEAQAKEAQAKANLARAKAASKEAKAEVQTIAGVAEAKKRAKETVAEVKAFVAADIAQTKADFKAAKERAAAWDVARGRQFDAQLDEADARIAAWKASADTKRVENAMKRHDELAALQESIALARARAAEAKREKYDDAYAAAAKRYDRGI